MRFSLKEAGLLSLVVCAVYANALSGSFHYDDFHSLVQNPHIRDWQRATDFFVDPALFSVDPAKAMYRPLLLVSYAFNYSIGGYGVMGYHLFNVLVHLTCVLLVWRIAGHWGTGALCAGLIFALHPVASEPVNYISSRSESLAVAFLLAAFICYLRRDRLGGILGPITFAAALLVKSIAIVLPGLLLLYEITRDGRRCSWRRHVPYWAVAAGYVALIVSNRFLGDSLAKAPRGLVSQLLTQCKAIVFYLKLLLVPVGLNVEPQFAAAETLTGAVMASAALIASVAYWALRGRGTRFYLGWFVLALSPTLLIPLNVLLNEHRLYLPLAGLALGGGVLWQRLKHNRWLWRPGLLCLLLWAGITAQRNTDWQDELSLWSAAAKPDSQMPRVHVHLGNALRDGGRLSEAREAYQKALALDPDNRPAMTNLANLYYEAAQKDSSQRKNYLQKAIRQYEEVLRLDPTYREARNNLGSAHMLLGDYERAETNWRQSIERHANHPEAHYNMGLLLVRMSRPRDAVAHYQRALALTEDAEIYNELGNALVGGGQLSEAKNAYGRAIALRPDDIMSRYNLAEVLLVLGEQALAKGQHRASLAIWRQALGELELVLKQVPGHHRAERRLQQLKERLR